MSDTETPKRRGRPSTGKALTSAERMQRVRAKAQQAFHSETPPDLSPLPDSAVLDFLRQSYQAKLTRHMASATAELFHRANARGAPYPLRPAFEPLAPASIPVTVADNPPSIPVTVAEKATEQDIGEPTATDAIYAETYAELDALKAEVAALQSRLTASDAMPAEPDAILATVAENKADKKRGYPPEVKALAVRMADEGQPTTAIRAAILDRLGRAPDISNMARLVRSWR